jgi:hypothetical protein
MCSCYCKLIWVGSLFVAMSKLFINEAFVELRFSNRQRKHINLLNKLFKILDIMTTWQLGFVKPRSWCSVGWII